MSIQYPRQDDSTTSQPRSEAMRVSVEAPMAGSYNADRQTRPLHRRSTSFASIAPVASIRSHIPRNLLSRLIIPLVILLSISMASAAQTEAAHYLLVEIEYNQPYFAFFLTHVSFAFVFPLHLLVLFILRPSFSPLSYLPRIRQVIAEQMGLPEPSTWRDIAPGWIKKSIGMTTLISLPALSWFIAVVFTTAMDVTTLYATSSFYAYFFSMMLLKQPLSRITVAAICLAFGGVLVIVLAGASGEDDEGQGPEARNRVLGDIVMTGGAVLLGLYEVVYKLALPEGHGGVTEPGPTPITSQDYSELPTHASQAEEFELSPPQSPVSNRPTSNRPNTNRPRSEDIPMRSPDHRLIHPKTSTTPLLRPRSTSPTPSDSSDSAPLKPPPHTPPELPTALLANFLTTSIGLTTIAFLWIPIPILHSLGWETFRWPGSEGGPRFEIWADLQVVAWGGAIYNAGLMILIGIWGPTTSSVANLLTIGLVAVFDAVWGGHVPDVQTLAGVAMICLGFGVLLWEGEG